MSRLVFHQLSNPHSRLGRNSDGHLTCCHLARFTRSNRDRVSGGCDIKPVTQSRCIIKYQENSKLAPRIKTSPPCLPPSFPLRSHGRHHQCVPNIPLCFPHTPLTSPRIPHRPSSGLPQAPAPLVRTQVLLRVLADRRRMGHPRSLPEDLETPSYQGMARAQDHLPLYQDFYAHILHRHRFVSARALHLSRLSYRPLFL